MLDNSLHNFSTFPQLKIQNYLYCLLTCHDSCRTIHARHQTALSTYIPAEAELIPRLPYTRMRGPFLSVQALSWVFDFSESTGGSRLTLLSIANHVSHDGDSAWPSVATIARESRLSERAVQYAIRELEGSGELGVQPGHGRGNTHLFNLPKYQDWIQDVRRVNEKRVQDVHLLNTEKVQSTTEKVQSTTLKGARFAPEPSLTVKEPSTSYRQEDLEPETKSVTDRDLAELWRDMRRAYKRKVGRTLGAAIYGNLGEKFRDIVNRHGQEKVLSGFMAYVEGKGKDYLRGRKIPIWNFLDEAEEWIDDAAITEEQPQDEARNSGPRGVGSKYAKL